MAVTTDGVIDVLQQNKAFLAAMLVTLCEAHRIVYGPYSTWRLALHVVIAFTSAKINYTAARRLLAGGQQTPQQLEWWSRQVAVVTGGEGGLGAAIINELQQVGCGKIISVDLKLKEAEGKNGDATTNGHAKVARFQCDVSSSEDVRQVAVKIRTELGADPTILISNAGITAGKPITKFKEGEFERTLAVNTHATYYWVRELLPAMLERDEGHIVATSSIMGYVGISQQCDYVASKHAVVGFMESLRYELDKCHKKMGVATTLLILGQLQTPLFARVHLSSFGHAFMPPAKPPVVARDVVRRLSEAARMSPTSSYKSRHGYVFRARTARLMPLLAALPLPLRNFIQDISGANESLYPASEADATRKWAD